MCIGFTNGEYRIVIVDFIAPCGGHQRTGKKDSEEPFLLYPEPRKRGSVDSNPLTRGIRCGGTLPLTREGFVPLCFAYIQVLLND